MKNCEKYKKLLFDVIYNNLSVKQISDIESELLDKKVGIDCNFTFKDKIIGFLDWLNKETDDETKA